ncbi:MAG: hypothetical protein BHV62_03135 [Eggerthella sp. 51_9]|nr:MAG: hypothetical protein BHV62_03135 [Eggerthella sp. 51_9]
MTLFALFPLLWAPSAGEPYCAASVQEGQLLRWAERGFLVSCLLAGAGSARESVYASYSSKYLGFAAVVK